MLLDFYSGKSLEHNGVAFIDVFLPNFRSLDWFNVVANVISRNLLQFLDIVAISQNKWFTSIFTGQTREKELPTLSLKMQL